VRVAELEKEPTERRWLLHGLWGHAEVGVIGGCPKVGKSWLGLDLAVSVASATPCLGHFRAREPGPALVYLAEDALPAVRSRIEGICRHRGLDIRALDLHVITAPTLRLDVAADRERLALALERLRPRLLLLDPLVRLHRLDENSASDISGLLGFLRELQRTFAVAVVLVHHAGKKSARPGGLSLRGSSDIHAWTDSSAYLARVGERLVLTIEHRAAPAPPPLTLRLVVQANDAHLEAIDDAGPTLASPPSLAETVLETLRAAPGPLARGQLRARLRVNNQRLGDALAALEKRGSVRRAADGWLLHRDGSARPPAEPSLFA
jgi:hypothetical protein